MSLCRAGKARRRRRTPGFKAAADEDGFLSLAGHLPPEASDALLDYVTTGILKKPAPVAPAADRSPIPTPSAASG
jgi:hypothetical protein